MRLYLIFAKNKATFEEVALDLTINSEHKHADDTKFLLWLYDTNIRKNMRLYLIFAKNKATFEEVALDDMRDLKSGCDLLTA